LFGGNDTKKMTVKLLVPNNRSLADFLPTVTIAAKNFATEVTNYNVKSNDLYGEEKITFEHVKNNKQVRGVMLENKIIPENLPVQEDIKKLEKRIKNADKNLFKK
jgi:DNA-damage-inducible protein D